MKGKDLLWRSDFKTMQVHLRVITPVFTSKYMIRQACITRQSLPAFPEAKWTFIGFDKHRCVTTSWLKMLLLLAAMLSVSVVIYTGVKLL